MPNGPRRVDLGEMAEDTYKGRKLSRYRLIDEIGKGGMALVYRGVDEVLDREVAVKILHPHLQIQQESKNRFEREAKAIAKLHHTNILQIYDYSGLESSPSYIVMELISGPTLRRFLEEHHKMPVEIGALIVCEVCRAVEHAHEQGVIHRDIKPENIMITPTGTLKLTDFGIAQLAGFTQMTVTGQILGSPAYMSPEHIEGKDLDFRADIFSLGTLLYQLVVGRLPFDGPNPHVVLKRITDGIYPDPLKMNPAVGVKLAGILQKCLATDREKRHQKVEELRRALEDFLGENGVSSPAETLSLYFFEPDVYAEEHRRQMVKRLLAMGISAQGRKDSVTALDAFNRLLAIEPGHAEAISRVSGIHSRQKIRRWVEKVAVVATIAVLLAALGTTFLKVTRFDAALKDRPRPAARPAASGGSALATPASTSPAEADPQAGPSAKGAPGRTASGPARTGRHEMRVVTFHPQPPSVDIYVDGQLAGTFGPSFNRMVLGTGDHQIRFVPRDRECCLEESWTQRIPPGTEPYRIGRSLRWRPASLVVTANTEADVIVAGLGQTVAGRPLAIPFTSGPDKEVTVEVLSKGYVPIKRALNLRAGRTTTVDVELKPITTP